MRARRAALRAPQTRQLPRCLTVCVCAYVAWSLLWSKAAPAPAALEDAGAYAPGFVEAFREGRVDWHALFYDWEALGRTDAVAREATRAAQLAAVLGPTARRWGIDHGGLRGAAACHLLRDKCAVHAAAACAEDELCALRGGSCRTGPRGAAAGACPAGTRRSRLVEGRWAEAPAEDCDAVVRGGAVGPLAVRDDAKMLFHWHAFFSDRLLPFRRRGAQVIFDDAAPPIPSFSPWLWAIAPKCWRRTSDVPERACFCRPETPPPPPAKIAVVAALRDAAGLVPLADLEPSLRPRLCLLSRRRKRFLLNEGALLAAAEALGLESVALPLEEMTLREQLDQLGACDVLAGVHGSGLNNIHALRPAAANTRTPCVLQLLPYLVGRRYAGAFPGMAERHGFAYVEWRASNASLSVFHWEYAPRAAREADAAGRRAWLRRRADADGGDAIARVSNSELYSFWINQDLRVPVDEWAAKIGECGLLVAP